MKNDTDKQQLMRRLVKIGDSTQDLNYQVAARTCYILIENPNRDDDIVMLNVLLILGNAVEKRGAKLLAFGYYNQAYLFLHPYQN